jgi:SAM-dependent methyltransferase
VVIRWRPRRSRRQHLGVADNYFDEWTASRYRMLWPHLFSPEVVDPAVALLADLAGTGPALELGIGTGRLALPLSRCGISIHGIELSSAMVEQLRAQPGADEIDVTIGDFATTRVAGTFRLAYLVRNTIMNLTTQDAQVECFRNVAAHLDPGGRFAIEVVVPPWQRLQPGETIVPFQVRPDHLGFDEIDVATQNSWSHHYWFVDGETKNFSAPFRYVWPSELDLMARLAGMQLRERWSSWTATRLPAMTGAISRCGKRSIDRCSATPCARDCADRSLVHACVRHRDLACPGTPVGRR